MQYNRFNRCVSLECIIYSQIHLADKYIATEEVHNRICAGYPTPTLQPRLIASSAILSTFVILFVGLRFWSRYAIAMEFWWDDWLVLAATVSFHMC